MPQITLLAFALLCCAEGEAKFDIARKVPGYLQPVEIVSQELSADGATGKVVFRAPSGIFQVNLDLTGTKLDKLSFIVRNVKSWEGVSFYPDGKDPKQVVELLRTAGVKVSAAGKDCLIEFDRQAIKILEQKGKLQFVDAYR